MSTPYGRDERFVITATPERVDMDFPGRCELTRIAIVEEGGGAIDVDIFNRKIVGTSLGIATITDDGSSQVLITLAAGQVFPEDEVAVGDLLTVAGSSVGGYNVATHRVLSISEDRRQAATSEAYTADGAGGTAQLDLSAIEEVFRVIPNIAGASPQLIIPAGTGDKVLHVNRDPQPNLNIGVNRKVYFRITGNGSYRIALDASLGVAGEG